jgi:hypothetical protein
MNLPSGCPPTLLVLLSVACVPNPYLDDILSDTSEIGLCGNGVVEGDEECDEGEQSTGTCNVSCVLMRCGDGITDPGDACYQFVEDISVGSEPRNLEFGFVNADQYGDLLVPSFADDNVSILLGQGNCSFAEEYIAFIDGDISGSGPYQVVVGDFNDDNIADFATANRSDTTMAVALGEGGGTFGMPESYLAAFYPTSIDAGDLNGDLELDLVVANAGAYGFGAYYGDGQGGFSDPYFVDSGAAPVFIKTIEITGDVFVDVLVANKDDQTITIHAGGAADGEFDVDASIAMASPARALAAADFDADGDIDIAATGEAGVVYVLLRETGLTFSTSSIPAGEYPFSIQAADLTGDTTSELAVANSGDDTLSLFAGAGDGTFSWRMDLPTGPRPIFVETGDCNADGIPDLFVSNEDSNTVTVYRSNP